MTPSHNLSKGLLTRFPAGSFLEYTWVSVPLILTMLSRGLMFFVDRLVVAKYSANSLNALTAAGTNFAVVLFAIYGITGIAQVFAGQANGAGEYKKVPRPVWQMIWFSLFANVVTIPLGILLPEHILAPIVYEEGHVYFELCMFFIFASGAVYALSAFFIAIGRTAYVTYGAIVANLLNLVLAVVFVLGVEGYVEPMGVKGAAVAQIVAESVEALYLLFLFLTKSNRDFYATHDFRFRADVFWSCLKVGVPSCVSHVLELSAWSVIAYILGTVGLVHLTVYSVFQAVFVFFAHIVSGMEKGLTTLVANAIGAKSYGRINTTLLQGFKFLLALCAVILLPIVLNPSLLVQQFLCDLDPQVLALTQAAIHAALGWILIYALIDGLAWLMMGVLTAAGDTKFIMFTNVTNVWLFAVMPVWLAARYDCLQPEHTWAIQCGYVLMNLLVMTLRYKSNRWKKIHING